MNTNMRSAKVGSQTLALLTAFLASGLALAAADGAIFWTRRDVSQTCNIDTSLQTVTTAPPIPAGSIVTGVRFQPVNYCGGPDCTGTGQYRVDSITVSLNGGPSTLFSGTTTAFNGQDASGTWRTGVYSAQWDCSAPSVSWSFYVSYMPSATLPTPTSVTPSSGPMNGGTRVTIRGRNFRNPSTVLFQVGARGAYATDVQFIDSQTLTATTPPNGPGWASVTVSGGNAVSSLFNYYSVPPTLTSVGPHTGLTAGHTQVTITGANFRSGATVTFGGLPATGVTFVNETTLQATTPAHARGPVDVRVNVNGQTGSLPNAFTYVTPAQIISTLQLLR